MRATYSPEDNKLRLYPDGRLSPADYERASAAGFRWAAAQELFVAPAWTPERAALLVELCGDIGDEDTTLEDRAEDRADRFDSYAEHRQREGDQAGETVHALMRCMNGQPVLVGHHSERRHRRDLERMDAAQARAVRCWETAGYWARRAAAAIKAAKYKQRPDVRARRIKALEADARRIARELDEIEKCRAFWADPPVDPARALAFANFFDHSAYSPLQAGRPVAEVAAARLAALAPAIERARAWAAHVAARLEYERALLAGDGGTVADQTRPEPGGAVRCWCSPGMGKHWSYIQRVNRVSVTVLDSWGNGTPAFRRTIPLDKLRGVMSRAEVEAARLAGRLIESGDGIGFALRSVPATAATAGPAPAE